MKLTREERETYLRTNEEKDGWELWTLSEIWARRMERLGYEVVKDGQGGWRCEVPLNRVTVRRKDSRIGMSEGSHGHIYKAISALRSKEIS